MGNINVRAVNRRIEQVTGRYPEPVDVIVGHRDWSIRVELDAVAVPDCARAMWRGIEVRPRLDVIAQDLVTCSSRWDDAQAERVSVRVNRAAPVLDKVVGNQHIGHIAGAALGMKFEAHPLHAAQIVLGRTYVAALRCAGTRRYPETLSNVNERAASDRGVIRGIHPYAAVGIAKRAELKNKVGWRCEEYTGALADVLVIYIVVIEAAVGEGPARAIVGGWDHPVKREPIEFAAI